LHSGRQELAVLKNPKTKNIRGNRIIVTNHSGVMDSTKLVRQ
jgi:hypothetical protein